jgi:small-conductance mechanosensitive channel
MMSSEPLTVDYGMVSTLVSGVVLIVNGWLVMLVRGYNARLDNLTSADSGLSEKINVLNARLSADYVLRSEFKTDMREQTDQLTRVMDKMESRITTAATSATVAAQSAAATAAAALSAATAAAAAALARTKES